MSSSTPNTGKAHTAASAGQFTPRSLHGINPLRRWLFGAPTRTERMEHTKIPKFIALPVFSSDAISSSVYASQQILLALGAAGLWTMSYTATYNTIILGVTSAIVILLAIVVGSYWQTIFAYPTGGGSYLVSKENLGTNLSLIAGASLLIDYSLTVAVSIAAGAQNLLSTPLMKPYQDQIVPVCIMFIAAITLANLRGLKESGLFFAIPTYLFILMAGTMILLGAVGPALGWEIDEASINHIVPPEAQGREMNLAGFALLFLALKAFANGCTALTGVEAVSDGVPAFKKPESLNAALTLVMMGVILAFLFGGISWLAVKFHVVYWEHGRETATPVIDQLASAIFSREGSPLRVALYYAMQFSVMSILVLAANTCYADFPRVSSILARDGFMPRQLGNLGDKLVFSNGIVLLGLCACILIVIFHGKVDDLIPLYAIGVFTCFTLSQTGMVVHWLKERSAKWRLKAAINGTGAAITFVVLVVFLVEKGLEGAWIVVVLTAIMIAFFRTVSRHYTNVKRQLALDKYEPSAVPLTNTVLLLVPRLHRGIVQALEYAKTLSPDCRAIHVEVNPSDTPRMIKEWEEYVGEDVPLVVLPSPYRSLVGPLMAYLDQVQRERRHHFVTVVLPEFVSRKWWHALLHNSSGLLLKLYLLRRPDVVVSNVRYFLEEVPQEEVAPE